MSVPEWVRENRSLTAVAGALTFLFIALLPVWLGQLWALFSTQDFVSAMDQSVVTRLLVGPLYGWISVVIGIVLMVLVAIAVFSPPPAPPPPPPRPRDVAPRPREVPPRRREEAPAGSTAPPGPNRLLGLDHVEPDKPSRVGPADWLKLADEFRRIRDTSVRADWTRTPTGDTWRVCGGMTLANQDCDVLCRTAGHMLIASPHVASVLSPLVTAEKTPAWRWLRYVREASSSFRSDLERSTEDGGYTTIGSIEDLTSVSARLCAECSALESVVR